MPRKRSTGLNTVTRMRSDGVKVVTYYHRRTGVRLGTDREEAIRLAAHLDGLHGGPETGTFFGLVTRYLGSPEYQRLSPGSQRTYRVYLDRLRETFGNLPLIGLTRPMVLRLRDKLASTPSRANETIKALRIVLQWAVDRGELRSNAASRPGMIPTRPRATIWTAAEIARFREAAADPVRLAFDLMLATAQRPGDVLALTWQDVRADQGRLWLTLRQKKTGKLVTIPASRELEATLIAAAPEPLGERRGPIVPSPKGKTWNLRNFSRVWDETMKAAGLEALQRRDLRRTAMVSMAIAGATEPQIASVSGHSIERTRQILDTYLPRRPELALGAIEALERLRANVQALNNDAPAGRAGGPGRTRTCNQAVMSGQL